MKHRHLFGFELEILGKLGCEEVQRFDSLREDYQAVGGVSAGPPKVLANTPADSDYSPITMFNIASTSKIVRIVLSAAYGVGKIF